MSTVALTLRQVRFTNKAFWRNPASAFFTFAFPLMFLVIFTTLFGTGTLTLPSGEEVKQSTAYVPAIAAFSVITACYTNIAISVTFARDAGVLKRTRGTPLPPVAYLLGRIIHAALVALLLVAICTAFGVAFYGAKLPTSTLPAFTVTLIVGAASFCTLGLAVTSIIPNADASPAIVNATVLPLLFLSGVFIPITSTTPAWVDAVGKIFPIRHFYDAMVNAFFPVSGGSGFRWVDLAVVAGWGLAGLIVAVRFFSWEPRR